MGNSWFERVLKGLSQKSRQKKFALLFSMFVPQPEDLALDVGASGEVFLQFAIEDVYPFPRRIVAGGTELSEVRSAREHYPQSAYALFDGCCLPFPDKSFDLVFSNAVIEHILGAGRQDAFAREIMRVGRSWFVTTPNYWFPFETHYHLPFIHFLPRTWQRTYNSLFGTQIPKGKSQDLGLLSARDLQRLFPTSRVVKLRFTLWPETLVAFYIDPERKVRRANAPHCADRG